MALTRDLIESNVRERARWRIAAGTTAGKQGKPISGLSHARNARGTNNVNHKEQHRNGIWAKDIS